jgi:predicted PurR-regulated permease PerM
MENEQPNPSVTVIADSLAGAAAAAGSRINRAPGIIAFAVTLALLYLGRDILIPLALALMLSLLLAPLVRVFRGTGMTQGPAVLVAVLASALAVFAIAVVLGTQVVRMAASLPQYQETIQQKLQNLDEITLGRLNDLTGEASRLIERRGARSTAPGSSPEQAGLPPAADVVPVQLQQPRADPVQIIRRVLASVWGPIETMGIVLVVLVFVLLEHESLRDRIIRMAGGTNIRMTTVALSDAGERLSRFFVSQFVVNLGVGVTIGIGLGILGLPHATLWATLAAVLRFVPYVGVWIAALFAVALGLAVVPGWSLAVNTFGLFVLVEVIAGQVVEPQLFGHTTGLSPLSVVVAAIFWSSLWGPIGLILSTPLTLCLLVGGRYIRTLRFLDLLLGNAPALTLPQRFYQRALSGDSQEVLATARAYLKRDSLAAYCDNVLMPALHLGLIDQQLGAISADQQAKMRNVVVTVFSTLGGASSGKSRRGRTSVLDGSAPGQRLRQEREQITGKWQGPLAVPPGSVMVCVGLGAMVDDLAAELLARVLMSEKLDARHFSAEDAEQGPPPEATPDGVAIVYLLSAVPGPERERSGAVAQRVRERLPGALLVNVFLPGVSLQFDAISANGNADLTVTSFVQAVQICLERREHHDPN